MVGSPGTFPQEQERTVTPVVRFLTPSKYSQDSPLQAPRPTRGSGSLPPPAVASPLVVPQGSRIAVAESAVV